MAYTSWSVIYGEQPSASKWNILGTNDASFNDGTGFQNGATLKSNPYKMSAYNATNQTGVTSNTWTTATLGTEEFDNNNNFTSSVYTVPVAGYYLITGQIYMDSSPGLIQGAGARIYKNNSTAILQNYMYDNNVSVDAWSPSVTGIFKLAANDTIRLQGDYVVSSGTATFAATHTRLSIHCISI